MSSAAGWRAPWRQHRAPPQQDAAPPGGRAPTLQRPNALPRPSLLGPAGGGVAAAAPSAAPGRWELQAPEQRWRHGCCSREEACCGQPPLAASCPGSGEQRRPFRGPAGEGPPWGEGRRVPRGGWRTPREGGGRPRAGVAGAPFRARGAQGHGSAAAAALAGATTPAPASRATAARSLRALRSAVAALHPRLGRSDRMAGPPPPSRGSCPGVPTRKSPLLT